MIMLMVKHDKQKLDYLPNKSVLRIMSLILIVGVLTVLLIYLDKRIGITRTYRSIHDMRLNYILVSCIVMACTYIVAAITLRLLSLKPLRFTTLLIVQASGGFASKVIPVGLGGLALNTRYLIKNKHSTSEAAIVAAANNIVGFLAHSTLVLIVLYAFTEGQHFNLPVEFLNIILIGISTLSIISITYLLLSGNFKKQIQQFLVSVRDVSRLYVRHPLRLLAAYFSSMCLTLLYALVLYLITLSTNLEINYLQCLIVSTIGVAAATITPTPGGIGGAEAGLAAALYAFGVSPADAVPVTIVYRLVTYWLPMFPGVLFLRYAIKRSYV